jgi:hypothetical protein
MNSAKIAHPNVHDGNRAHLTHRVVRVPKQRVAASPMLGVDAFSGTAAAQAARK